MDRTARRLVRLGTLVGACLMVGSECHIFGPYSYVGTIDEGTAYGYSVPETSGGAASGLVPGVIAWSPSGDEIVFASWDLGRGHRINALHVETGTIRTVVEAEAPADLAVWGDWVFYTAGDPRGIYKVPSAGGEATLLAETELSYVLSRDGERLIMGSEAGGAHVRVLDLGTGVEQELPALGVPWLTSPDDAEVLVGAGSDGSLTSLDAYPVDGSGESLAVWASTESGQTARSAHWEEGAFQVLYTAVPSPARVGVFVYDVPTADARQLIRLPTHMGEVYAHSADGSRVAVWLATECLESPDADLIFSTCVRWQWHLYVIDVALAQATTVGSSQFGTEGQPEYLKFSPDGTMLAWAARGRVYVKPAE